MSTLLSKFRISYKSLTMINDIMDPPQEGTVKFFTDLLSDYTNPNNARGNYQSFLSKNNLYKNLIDLWCTNCVSF